MTKVSQSYYSTAVGHKQLTGCFHSSFAAPGEAPLWVTGPDGKPKIFKNPTEAELAGYRVLVTRLNRARSIQSFQTKNDRKNGSITSFRAEPKQEEHTAESVFRKK